MFVMFKHCILKQFNLTIIQTKGNTCGLKVEKHKLLSTIIENKVCWYPHRPLESKPLEKMIFALKKT